jgi:hypothetical protein
MAIKTNSWKKTFTKILIVFVILGIGTFTAYFYLPYGDSSVKAGQLNYVMHKGILFKTYEGKLIQTGLKSGTSGGMQSNEFEFSIANKELANRLMGMAGKNVKLHYKEYFGVLPWRGYTKYIVDSIISVDENPVEAIGGNQDNLW